VLAALLAVVLAAGGGYGGYELVRTRPVKVEHERLSVEVYRDWDQKSEGDGPSLLVSTDTAKWQTDSGIEGVFVGVIDGTALPKTGTPPPGCSASTTDPKTPTNVVTFKYGCDGPSVDEQYRLLDGGKLLRIQVRDDNPGRRAAVLASATYSSP
jgi:hypothetical protein